MTHGLGKDLHALERWGKQTECHNVIIDPRLEHANAVRLFDLQGTFHV